MVALHDLCHDHLARYDALLIFARTRHALMIRWGRWAAWIDGRSWAASGATVVLREIRARTLGSCRCSWKTCSRSGS